MDSAARVLTEGTGEGDALVLSEPLSFWGGVDPATGAVIDRRHPQLGSNVAGKVLVMSCGRGSSSASSVLAEVVRAGVGPAAIVLSEPDPILVLGSLVASELYGKAVPMVVVTEEELASIPARSRIEVSASEDEGSVRVHPH